MKEEIKDRWVEALRSGEYKQGKKALKMDGNFCCLGVLCDLHAKEVGGDWEDLQNRRAQRYFGCIGLPPYEVQYWAETKHSSGKEIANLNDVQNYTFEQIADWIERNWERL